MPPPGSALIGVMDPVADYIIEVSFPDQLFSVVVLQCNRSGSNMRIAAFLEMRI